MIEPSGISYVSYFCP